MKRRIEKSQSKMMMITMKMKIHPTRKKRKNQKIIIKMRILRALLRKKEGSMKK